jgi:murein DD-endopeptidase MepM/ murein hydrolase activator NlpD
MNPVIALAGALLTAGLLVTPDPGPSEPRTPPPAAAAATSGTVARTDWLSPLTPLQLVRGFQRPEQAWSAGHRGIDLQARVGTAVAAVAPGVVVVAGPVAGRGVVSIQHGALRSSYEPVLPTVAPGDRVAAGEPIGLLAAGGHCGGCLHLGARTATGYADPWPLLNPGVRLLPTPASRR